MTGNREGVDFETKRWVWGTDIEQPRFLHLAIRIKDVDKSVRFYVEGLGMKLIDRIVIAPRRVTTVFVGYSDYASGGLIELAHYWDDAGPRSEDCAFGHISVGVPD